MMKKRANQELALYAGILQGDSGAVSARPRARRGGGALHDVGAVGGGDQDVEIKEDVQVAAEVWSSAHRPQASVHTRQASAEAPPGTGHTHPHRAARPPFAKKLERHEREDEEAEHEEEEDVENLRKSVPDAPEGSAELSTAQPIRERPRPQPPQHHPLSQPLSRTQWAWLPVVPR